MTGGPGLTQARQIGKAKKMERRVTIPVRIQERATIGAVAPRSEADSPERQNNEVAAQPRTLERHVQQAPAALSVEATPEAMPCDAWSQDQVEEWRARALRLMAEMDNYRKRQQRLAQDQIEQERQALLSTFLQIVDDLERALMVPAGNNVALRQGIRLTHQSALQLLHKEGVEPIEAQNQPFDPNWHQAVATTGSSGTGVLPDTVVEVVETGYRSGDRLLRPAKVIVAV